MKGQSMSKIQKYAGELYGKDYADFDEEDDYGF